MVDPNSIDLKWSIVQGPAAKGFCWFFKYFQVVEPTIAEALVGRLQIYLTILMTLTNQENLQLSKPFVRPNFLSTSKAKLGMLLDEARSLRLQIYPDKFKIVPNLRFIPLTRSTWSGADPLPSVTTSSWRS